MRCNKTICFKRLIQLTRQECIVMSSLKNNLTEFGDGDLKWIWIVYDGAEMTMDKLREP